MHRMRENAMKNLLIVSGNTKSLGILNTLIVKSGGYTADYARSCKEAEGKLQKKSFSILLINPPFEDGDGISLALLAAETFGAGVMLLVKEDLAEQVWEKTGDSGVFIVTKPLHPALVSQGLKFLEAANKKLLRLREENFVLAKKMEDLKVIDRAKCCLMEYLKMSEGAAHRYIEKQAMDLRLSKRQVAENILTAYEN